MCGSSVCNRRNHMLILRAPPQSGARGIAPRIAGLLGTYLAVAVVLLPFRTFASGGPDRRVSCIGWGCGEEVLASAFPEYRAYKALPSSCQDTITSSLSTRGKARESVGAPVFAADAVVHEEEAIRIVFVLDRAQLRVIPAPERLLPARIEVVALRDIRSRSRRNFAQLRRGEIDQPCILSRGRH